MQTARVLFFGYNRIGIHALRELLKHDVKIVGVFCRSSDRDPGPSSLFHFAKDQGLRVFEETSPQNKSFLESLKDISFDYLVSVQYDRIIKPAVFEKASLAAINLHFGPLPRLRGCFPTKWAIINDEDSGVTLHHIDAGVDTGAIIDQIKVPLNPQETDASLYRRLTGEGMALLTRWAEAIAKKQVPAGVPQNDNEASYNPKSLPHDGEIDWNWPANKTEAFIRAFINPPHPGAKAYSQGTPFEFPDAVAIKENCDVVPGQVRFDGKGALFGCGKASIFSEYVRVHHELRSVQEFLKDGEELTSGEK